MTFLKKSLKKTNWILKREHKLRGVFKKQNHIFVDIIYLKKYS